jgi:hypothetical protein
MTKLNSHKILAKVHDALSGRLKPHFESSHELRVLMRSPVTRAVQDGSQDAPRTELVYRLILKHGPFRRVSGPLEFVECSVRVLEQAIDVLGAERLHPRPYHVVVRHTRHSSVLVHTNSVVSLSYSYGTNHHGYGAVARPTPAPRNLDKFLSSVGEFTSSTV